MANKRRNVFQDTLVMIAEKLNIFAQLSAEDNAENFGLARDGKENEVICETIMSVYDEKYTHALSQIATWSDLSETKEDDRTELVPSSRTLLEFVGGDSKKIR